MVLKMVAVSSLETLYLYSKIHGILLQEPGIFNLPIVSQAAGGL